MFESLEVFKQVQSTTLKHLHRFKHGFKGTPRFGHLQFENQPNNLCWVSTSSIFCLMLLFIQRETPTFADTRRNKARPYGCLTNVTKLASRFSFRYGRRPQTGSIASLSVCDMPKGAAFATREVANVKW